jgi:hypothetical protein
VVEGRGGEITPPSAGWTAVDEEKKTTDEKERQMEKLEPAATKPGLM